jgi:hypothetical protein
MPFSQVYTGGTFHPPTASAVKIDHRFIQAVMERGTGLKCKSEHTSFPGSVINACGGIEIKPELQSEPRIRIHFHYKIMARNYKLVIVSFCNISILQNGHLSHPT